MDEPGSLDEVVELSADELVVLELVTLDDVSDELSTIDDDVVELDSMTLDDVSSEELKTLEETSLDESTDELTSLDESLGGAFSPVTMIGWITHRSKRFHSRSMSV